MNEIALCTRRLKGASLHGALKGLALAFSTVVSMLACSRPAAAPPKASLDATTRVSVRPRGFPETAPVALEDSILRIPLKNGDTAVFVSNPHAEETTIDYTYDGHLRGVPFHGVAVRHYEATSYLLVHDSTGRRTAIPARPIPSPSGRELVVASYGLDSDMEPNVLQILSLDEDRAVRMWELIPADWGPKDPVWIGDDSVRLTRRWAREERRSMPESPAMLVRRPTGWEVLGIVPDALPEDTTEVH